MHRNILSFFDDFYRRSHESEVMGQTFFYRVAEQCERVKSAPNAAFDGIMKYL